MPGCAITQMTPGDRDGIKGAQRERHAHERLPVQLVGGSEEQRTGHHLQQRRDLIAQAEKKAHGNRSHPKKGFDYILVEDRTLPVEQQTVWELRAHGRRADGRAGLASHGEGRNG